MTDVVVVRGDEDHSHALPKRMTNEDVTRMQCRIAIDIVFTYSLHAIHYFAVRQYTSAKKDKWPLNRRDGSFIGNSDIVFCGSIGCAPTVVNIIPQA